jgi:hypothetical protein
MFKFQAVLARTQPFLSRSVEKRGDQSRFKCRKWSSIMQFAVVVVMSTNPGKKAAAEVAELYLTLDSRDGSHYCQFPGICQCLDKCGFCQ